MSKRIADLIPDIEKVLTEGKSEVNAKRLSEAAVEVGMSMKKQLVTEERDPRPEKTLYASEIGKPCRRELWHRIHKPEAAGVMHGNAKFKFMYGDVIESIIMWLAEEAGHDVVGRQDAYELEVGRGWKVRGRIDGIIDGVLLDVKSAAPAAMKKFKDGMNDKNDAFGYRKQLSFYSQADKERTGESKQAGFLAIDKSNGAMILDIRREYSAKQELIPLSDLERLEETIESPWERLKPSSSGALQLGCRYCAFIHTCWPNAREEMRGKYLTVVTGE